MAVLDIVLLVLFIPAVVRGISKGFVEQAFALAAIVVSGKLAFTFAGRVGERIGEYIETSGTLLYIISFLIIVICTVLVLKLCATVISKLISAISLGWVNRLLGFAMAILNTALVLGLLFTLFNDVNDKMLHLGTKFMDDSLIYGWIDKLTGFIFPKIEQLFSSAKDIAA